MKKNDLSVIFLMWIPYGQDYLISFIESYLKFESGVEHNLVILFNGSKDPAAINPYLDFLKSKKIDHSYLELETGQDIAAYRWAASQLDSEYVLFFNTYSQIQHDNWGRNYLNSIKKDNIGCVGATGSWMSWFSYGFQRARFLLSSNLKIRQYLPYFEAKKIEIASLNIVIPARLTLIGALIKSIIKYNNFPKYPNPHLRTNAFIIKREFWLSLNFPGLGDKKQAHQFESGANSFTKQILRSGKSVLVMNKYGELFEPKFWNKSKTLWSYGQSDLLVSDNFTRQYEVSSKENQLAFQNFLWGSR